MCSSLSFDHRQSPGFIARQQELHAIHGGEEDADSANSEDRGGKIMLPFGHQQIHQSQQHSTLKQKTLILKRAHYQEYPYFHKREDTVIRDHVCIPPERTLTGLPKKKVCAYVFIYF